MGQLHNDVYSRLRSSVGRTPLPLWVLLCPIVSFVSSHTYHLSNSSMANLLQPVVRRTSYHVKNSREFVDLIRSERLTSEETMISFYVVSLFTCVPTDLAVQVPRCRLENDASFPECTNLTVDDIIDLLTLCL